MASITYPKLMAKSQNTEMQIISIFFNYELWVLNQRFQALFNSN